MKDLNDLSVNVDVGENGVALIQKLADQIGKTSTELFPWYVKNQIIESWCYLGTTVSCFVLGIILIVLNCDKVSVDPNKPNANSTITFCGFIITIVSFLFFVFGLHYYIGSILNPEYYALKSVIADMARIMH